MYSNTERRPVTLYLFSEEGVPAVGPHDGGHDGVILAGVLSRLFQVLQPSQLKISTLEHGSVYVHSHVVCSFHLQWSVSLVPFFLPPASHIQLTQDKLNYLCFSVFILYVAWKRRLPRNCARYVLFHPIKKRSFNLLCVLDLFFTTLAVNSVPEFFFFSPPVIPNCPHFPHKPNFGGTICLTLFYSSGPQLTALAFYVAIRLLFCSPSWRVFVVVVVCFGFFNYSIYVSFIVSSSLHFPTTSLFVCPSWLFWCKWLLSSGVTLLLFFFL